MATSKKWKWKSPTARVPDWTTNPQPASLFEQVDNYLGRMRHALPFPCTPQECYFGCVPPAVKAWNGEGVFAADTFMPGRVGNLLLTMHQTNIPTMARSVLHICTESAEQFLEAQLGNRGYERLFWIKIPEEVPVPRNSMQQPFYLPTDHPHSREIRKWVADAFAIEDEIEKTMNLIRRFSQLVDSGAAAVKLFPELNNFVTFKGGSQTTSPASREAVLKLLRPRDREAILFQLARAVMLPEKSAKLNAWVKFYTQEVSS